MEARRYETTIPIFEQTRISCFDIFVIVICHVLCCFLFFFVSFEGEGVNKNRERTKTR